MNARDIQRRILVERYRQSRVCPNFTPADWWECDVFELTDAGYFREFEIKLSLSDFKADAEKRRFGMEYNPVLNKIERPALESKHKRLMHGDPAGPAAFFFVTPHGLLTPEIVPEWAGWIEARERPNRKAPYNVSLILRKNAPRLHREKAGQKVVQQFEKVFYYRFHTLFIHQGEKPQATLPSPEELAERGDTIPETPEKPDDCFARKPS